MKQLLVILSVSLFLSSSAVGQTSASANITGIPGIHSWDYNTDYSETGHLTRDTGSESLTFDVDLPLVTFDEFSRQGDMLNFWMKYSSDWAILVRDMTPGKFRSIDIQEYVPGYSGPCSFRSTSSLHLENITMTESATDYSCTLQGNQLQEHAFSSMYEACAYSQSGDQSWHDVTFSTAQVNQGSQVTFTISKHDILTASVSANAEAHQLLVNPQPADSYLLVSIPQDFRHESLIVTDILGRESLRVAVPIGLRAMRINVSTLPSGTYFLSTASGSQLFLVRH